jgi:hypothetical protein
MDAETIQTITAELSAAYQARAAGNQGKARVCARRAAGWAIEAHLAAQVGHPVTHNALDNLKYFAEQPDLSPRVREVLQHLILKVEKDSLDSDAYYPLPEVDLIAEAHWLAEQMLGVQFFPDKS